MSLASESREAREMYEYLTSQIALAAQTERDLGWMLWQLKTKNLFKKAVGDMSWREFLAQPEIGISVRRAEYLIGYSALCRKFGLVIAPSESLKFLVYKLPDVNEQMVSDASHLNVKDFKERYYEIKQGDNAPKTYEYIVMKRCVETGTLTKEHTVSSAEAESLCLTD